MALKNLWLMTLILLMGAFLRGRGLAWGLPYLLDGDEFRVVYNGLSVYYTGQQRSTADSAMQSYPPLRSWEIAATRALLGDSLSIGHQVFWGRFFSFSYSLLICALIFALGKRIFGNGLWAAAFWATWEVREARLLLADMPALFFFLLTIYAAWRKRLFWAALAGILAGLAKYNMLPILALPAGLILIHIWRAPKESAEHLFFPLLLCLLPLAALFFRSVNLDGVKYEYFDPAEAARYVEQVPRPLSPNDQFQYASHSAGWAGRGRMNLALIRQSMSLGILLLACVGLLRGRAWVLVALALLQFVLISRFRALGARQLLGIMAILLLLAESGLNRLVSWQRGFILLGLLLAFVQAQKAYQTGDFLRRPDSRAAVANWLETHAPTQSRIFSETEFYELDWLHGLRSGKSFQKVNACPQADYLISQQAGGETLAAFSPPRYTGGELYIYLISDSSACDQSR